MRTKMRTSNTRDLWAEHDEIKERLEAIEDEGEEQPDDEDVDRLARLRAFLAEVDPDRDGVELIDESDWKGYAEQYACDCGMVDEDSSIWYYVDWDRWADALRSDYSVATLDGTDYYYRS